MKTNEIYKKGIEEFNKRLGNKLVYIGSSGQEHLNKIKVHIKTLTLDILKADIERLENTMLGGTNINRDTRVYNSALQDQIDYYQEQIKEINQQTL